jgi:hypothetical protein
MTDNATLRLLNALPLPGWLLLAVGLFVPGLRDLSYRVGGVYLPAVVALGYLALLVFRRDPTQGNFFSFEGLSSLFRSPKVLLAGWAHYIAFDLFVGTWIARVGTAHGLHPLLLLGCLGLTLMVGPVGYLGAVVSFVIAGVSL